MKHILCQDSAISSATELPHFLCDLRKHFWFWACSPILQYFPPFSEKASHRSLIPKDTVCVPGRVPQSIFTINRAHAAFSQEQNSSLGKSWECLINQNTVLEILRSGSGKEKWQGRSTSKFCNHYKVLYKFTGTGELKLFSTSCVKLEKKHHCWSVNSVSDAKYSIMKDGKSIHWKLSWKLKVQDIREETFYMLCLTRC